MFFPVFLLVGKYGNFLGGPNISSFDLKVLSLMPTLSFFMLFSFICDTLFLTGGILGIASQYHKIERKTVVNVFLAVIAIILILLPIISMFTSGY